MFTAAWCIASTVVAKRRKQGLSSYLDCADFNVGALGLFKVNNRRPLKDPEHQACTKCATAKQGRIGQAEKLGTGSGPSPPLPSPSPPLSPPLRRDDSGHCELAGTEPPEVHSNNVGLKCEGELPTEAHSMASERSKAVKSST